MTVSPACPTNNCISKSQSVGAGTTGDFMHAGVENSYYCIASKANVNGNMLTASERRGGASTHCVACPWCYSEK